jgi:phage terminase large subunit GpA-like protein
VGILNHLLPIALGAIDSGDGMTTAEACALVRRGGAACTLPVRGKDTLRAAVGTPSATEVRRNGRRRGGSGLAGRVVLPGRRDLRLAAAGAPTLERGSGYQPGYIHLPNHTAGEEVCLQLTSEQLVARRGRNRYRRLEGVKTRERNEALDCWVYARAAAAALGMDGWGQGRWQRLKENLAAQPPAPAVRRASASGAFLSGASMTGASTTSSPGTQERAAAAQPAPWVHPVATHPQRPFRLRRFLRSSIMDD